MALLRKFARPARGRFLTGIIACLLFFVPLASCAPMSGPGPEPLQFVAIDLHLPALALNAPVVGPLPDNTQMRVGITFKVSQSILDQFDKQKIQPGKRSQLENFASRIGIDDATYTKIKSFFNLRGISLQLSKLRTHLTIGARAKTIATLLRTHFVVHRLQGHTYFAPATPPRLPRFLADSIDAITGLDNYSTPPRTGFLLQPAARAHARRWPAQDCAAPDRTLLPKTVAHAYGYDQLWNRGWHGENMAVNLVEIDGFDQNDIQNYFNCINFKGRLNVSDVDGAPTQAVGESALDIEMVAGQARAVTINDYETDGNAYGDIWTQVNDELQQIIDDNTNNANSGSLVSISLGVAESQITQDDRVALEKSIQILNQLEHMTVFVASGDCGAFTDGVYRSLSVSFPASDPWATAVGGTILSVDGNSDRANEVVWSDASHLSSCKNRWGSGGGLSEAYARPSWQATNGASNQNASSRRGLPDVSAAAYDLPIYFGGQWGVVGGTSAAAPIWAAGMALVNEGAIRQLSRFAYSPRLFYQEADASGGMRPFYDVTGGNNLYYPATPGRDLASGLGTPNLADFFSVLSRTA